MKRILLSLFVATLSLGFVATQVEAKRLGGGSTSGMKRQTPAPQPAQPPAQSVPAKPAAAPGATAPAAPAAAPKRSWMGPIAGLAAGLGIAALMSHLGLGAEFGNLVMMVLLGLVAFVLVRFLLRRFSPSRPAADGGMQLAGAGAPMAKAPLSFPDERPAQYRG
ncbi:MAG TPA: Tim44 domain-containing protein, partial [Rhizobacter sp.]|nr:Tim44 domain-containing protein [Rhizobacter sp.]